MGYRSIAAYREAFRSDIIAYIPLTPPQQPQQLYLLQSTVLTISIFTQQHSQTTVEPVISPLHLLPFSPPPHVKHLLTFNPARVPRPRLTNPAVAKIKILQ